VACAVLVVAACAGEGGGLRPHDRDREQSSVGTDKSLEDPPDAEVLRAYVTALAQGDVDAAIDLRCENDRPAGAKRDDFRNDVGVLADVSGTPAVDRVVENHPPTGLLPSVGPGHDPEDARWPAELHPTELSYWLRVGDDVAERPLITVVVDENGERRLCGAATHLTKELYQRSWTDDLDLGPPGPGDLSALMPAGMGEGYRQIEDAAFAPDDMPGSPEAWTRAWQPPGYGGGRVTATRLESTEAALDGLRRRVLFFAAGAASEFDVPGVTGAVGLRVNSLSWLFVHPTGRPPYLDIVFLVFGSVLVEVSVTVLEPGADHGHVTTVATDVVGRARG
jgi:hypothetical protein